MDDLIDQAKIKCNNHPTKHTPDQKVYAEFGYFFFFSTCFKGKNYYNNKEV